MRLLPVASSDNIVDCPRDSRTWRTHKRTCQCNDVVDQVCQTHLGKQCLKNKLNLVTENLCVYEYVCFVPKEQI